MTTSDPTDPVDPAEVRFAAMNLLARREHSSAELRRKLARRFADSDLVLAVVQRLSDEKLQSDERFAESYVYQRSNRGYGPARIFQELRQRGLTDSAIKTAMEAGQYDWYANAAAVLERKFGTEPAADIKEKARRGRFMQYRGFSSDHFRDIL